MADSSLVHMLHPMHKLQEISAAEVGQKVAAQSHILEQLSIADVLEHRAETLIPSLKRNILLALGCAPIGLLLHTYKLHNVGMAQH